MGFGASNNKRLYLRLWQRVYSAVKLFHTQCSVLAIVALSRATGSMNQLICVWSYVSLSCPIGLFRLRKEYVFAY